MKEIPSQERLKYLKSQWDYDRNGILQFDGLKFGSGKKVWWKCDKGEDHVWQTRFVNRINGSECPICAGRLIVKSNCLQTTHPKLAKEWHPTKNGELTPVEVYKGSQRKVWWLCPKNADHEYESQIKHRVAGGGCPICNGKKVILSTSISSTHPELVKEWHPTKNIIKPNEVVYGSDKIVWWKCIANPKHEWKSRINKRTIRGQGCPFCSGRKADDENNLLVNFPQIASQWDYEKNNKLRPEQFRPRSNKKVWWICDKDNTHSWESTITNRVQGFGCPICSGQKVHNSNSLQTLFPEIAKQWHPTMNGTITPSDIVAGTNKKYWWKCEIADDHEWQSSAANRIAGRNCPVCEGLKIVKSNCLATTHSKLSKQWHPTKNNLLTPYDVIAGSHKLVWWKCKENPLHEWRTSIKNRASLNHGCPYCRLTPQSKQELSILFELKNVFSSINPKGYYFVDNGKRWTIDIFIKELNLGIEFDGSYWHKNKDIFDKQKNSICIQNGFKIIRIREYPLILTSEHDIISEIPFSTKIVTDRVLRKIIEITNLSEQQKQIIDAYLLKQNLQSEIELDNYIKRLLRNKERKNEPPTKNIVHLADSTKDEDDSNK